MIIKSPINELDEDDAVPLIKKVFHNSSSVHNIIPVTFQFRFVETDKKFLESKRIVKKENVN